LTAIVGITPCTSRRLQDYWELGDHGLASWYRYLCLFDYDSA